MLDLGPIPYVHLDMKLADAHLNQVVANTRWNRADRPEPALQAVYQCFAKHVDLGLEAQNVNPNSQHWTNFG